MKIRQLARLVGRHYEAHAAATGLKNTQYSLLSHVLKLGPMRPSDLAQAMMMEPSTLTRNLKPLVAQGWIEQAPGEDGRSRLVHITPAGRAQRALAQRHWRTAQQSLNQLLGVPRVNALHGLIQASLAALDQAAA